MGLQDHWTTEDPRRIFSRILARSSRGSSHENFQRSTKNLTVPQKNVLKDPYKNILKDPHKNLLEDPYKNLLVDPQKIVWILKRIFLRIFAWILSCILTRIISRIYLQEYFRGSSQGSLQWSLKEYSPKFLVLSTIFHLVEWNSRHRTLFTLFDGMAAKDYFTQQGTTVGYKALILHTKKSHDWPAGHCFKFAPRFIVELFSVFLCCELDLRTFHRRRDGGGGWLPLAYEIGRTVEPNLFTFVLSAASSRRNYTTAGSYSGLSSPPRTGTHAQYTSFLLFEYCFSRSQSSAQNRNTEDKRKMIVNIIKLNNVDFEKILLTSHIIRSS